MSAQPLNAEQKQRLRQFSNVAVVIVALTALMVFWAGLFVLQHDVFKNYYNPGRHIIVQQDPETLEVYAWKDAANRVFTRDSTAVRLFPYGVMALILLLMGFSSGFYNFLVQSYTSRLVRQVTPEMPVSVSQQRRAARG